MPRLTVITSELLLKKKYGESNYKKIADFILQNTENNLEILDKTSPIYSSFSNSTIEKNLKNPEKVKRGVDEIIKKHPSDNAMLLGGPDIIPFQIIKTECKGVIEDKETYPETVLSDLPYGSSNPYASSGKVSDYWTNFRPVTRLPDVTYSDVYDGGGRPKTNFKPTAQEIKDAFKNFYRSADIAFKNTNISADKYKSDIFAYTFNNTKKTIEEKIEDATGNSIKAFSKSDGLYYENIPCNLYGKYNHFLMLHGNRSTRYFKFVRGVFGTENMAYMPSKIYEIKNGTVCTFPEGVIALLNCCFSGQLNYTYSEKNWYEKIAIANIYMEYGKLFMGNTDIGAHNLSSYFTSPYLRFLTLIANGYRGKKIDFGKAVCEIRNWLTKAHNFDTIMKYYLSILTFYGNPNFIMK